MERLTSNSPLPAPLRGGVIALGNFDGFHRGHQAVVDHARALARAEGRPLIVATFDPHPVRYFRPDAPPFRLTSLDQRARLFAGAGADATLVFSFESRLANSGTEEFVSDYLCARAGAAIIVTGRDFTFGKGRSGSIEMLKKLAPRFGMRADAVAPVMQDDEPVSSSRIRKALVAGDCVAAADLLTRPFTIEGVVEHGAKLGRELGFPTANLRLRDYQRPAYGIYAVRGRLADGRLVDGCANLGIRPSFDPPEELLEPYFFDFSGDLYDQTIQVELIAHLRPEAKFNSLDSLRAQIDADCEEARRVLATSPLLA